MIAHALRVVPEPDNKEPTVQLVEGVLCVGCSKAIAVKRCHMVQGQAEYCGPCAAWAKRVYDALGTHMHIEDLALTVLQDSRRPDRGERQIDLG